MSFNIPLQPYKSDSVCLKDTKCIVFFLLLPEWSSEGVSGATQAGYGESEGNGLRTVSTKLEDSFAHYLSQHFLIRATFTEASLICLYLQVQDPWRWWGVGPGVEESRENGYCQHKEVKWHSRTSGKYCALVVETCLWWCLILNSDKKRKLDGGNVPASNGGMGNGKVKKKEMQHGKFKKNKDKHGKFGKKAWWWNCAALPGLCVGTEQHELEFREHWISGMDLQILKSIRKTGYSFFLFFFIRDFLWFRLIHSHYVIESLLLKLFVAFNNRKDKRTHFTRVLINKYRLLSPILNICLQSLLMSWFLQNLVKR